VTGSNGFIAKNLIAELETKKGINILSYNRLSTDEQLDLYCEQADFVFHLAGVNRPKTDDEFMEGNYDFTTKLLNTLKKHGNNCPIVISSSTQASQDNPYGLSKK